MNNLDKLKIIANKTRQLIIELKEYDQHLTGACGVSSLHIMRCAKKNKIPVMFIYGLYYDKHEAKHAHAWVRYENYVIDITKTQFDYYDDRKSKEVSILYRPKKYKTNKYSLITNNISEALDCINGFSNYPAHLRKELIRVP